MLQTTERAVSVSQVPYSVTPNPLSVASENERPAVCNHQNRATGQTRLLWSYDDVCADLKVSRLVFNRALRKRVIPQPSIRSLGRGRLFYDEHQYRWLKQFFSLLAETQSRDAAGRFTQQELVEMLLISDDEFRRYSALDFAPWPIWSYGDRAYHYSTAQLAWWVQFLALQARKGYDPSVNFVPADEAHLLLGLARGGFQRFLAENPALKPTLSLKPGNQRVYHKEQLASLRWSLAFRPGSAKA